MRKYRKWINASNFLFIFLIVGFLFVFSNSVCQAQLLDQWTTPVQLFTPPVELTSSLAVFDYSAMYCNYLSYTSWPCPWSSWTKWPCWQSGLTYWPCPWGSITRCPWRWTSWPLVDQITLCEANTRIPFVLDPTIFERVYPPIAAGINMYAPPILDYLMNAQLNSVYPGGVQFGGYGMGLALRANIATPIPTPAAPPVF